MSTGRDSKLTLLIGQTKCPSYLHSVGAHISQPSDWAAIPFPLLRDACELQGSALDNCAAACVCKSWQAAVKCSCVGVLHLHVQDKVSLPSRLAQCRAYLAARSNIGELKLTAGGSAVQNGNDNYLGIDDHLNPLACVPANCNSLTVDEYFAPFVADYAEQLAKLQHLAIKYREQSTNIETSGRNPWETLNKLSHLTQLRSLMVEASGNVRGLAGLHNFPKSLTRLCIGGRGDEQGWGDDDLKVDLPAPDSWWRRESECLRRLANFTVHNCRVQTPVGSTTNLQSLTSLSFNHSTVGRDFDAVLKLTNLVSLDLTGVMIAGFSILDEEERQLQPWSRFEAWPALHEFKFAGCQLVDDSTEMDIANVQEVHTDRLASGMETASIHLFLWRIKLESLASLLSPAWSTHIVDLHVVVSDGTALHLATIVNQVLEALLCLQSFQLSGGFYEGRQADNIDCGQGTIVLGDGYSGQLRNLQLQDMHCSTLDLEVATCLTRISLKSIENQGVSCELILPSSVVRLEFYGNGLTTRHAKCLLEGLPSLTHVTLGVNKFGHRREPELKDFACMPTMPSSLRRLSVTSSSLKKLLDGSARECLRRCTNLEHLILPLFQYPKEQLDAWVKDARHVRVSDNDTEEIPRWPYENTFYYTHDFEY